MHYSLDTHTSATAAHGSDGNVVGQNTLDSAISTHINTDIGTAHPNGNLATSRLSGTISNTQIAGDAVTSDKIDDGTIATSDMANTNVSQWTNDSGYITDGNTGWDNTYGFIDDGNTNWDNTYGFITKSGADSTYSSSDHNHDHGSLTELGDDDHTQYFLVNGTRNYSGNLSPSNPGACTATQNDIYENDADCLTVDGVDVSELEDRVISLSDTTSNTTAFAYGSMTGSQVENDLNMSLSVSISGTIGNGSYCIGGGGIGEGNYTYTLSFSAAATDSNYVVIVTPTDTDVMGGRVISKSTTGFSVRLYNWVVNSTATAPCHYTTTGTFDFTVYDDN